MFALYGGSVLGPSFARPIDWGKFMRASNSYWTIGWSVAVWAVVMLGGGCGPSRDTHRIASSDQLARDDASPASPAPQKVRETSQSQFSSSSVTSDSTSDSTKMASGNPADRPRYPAQKDHAVASTSYPTTGYPSYEDLVRPAVGQTSPSSVRRSSDDTSGSDSEQHVAAAVDHQPIEDLGEPLHDGPMVRFAAGETSAPHTVDVGGPVALSVKGPAGPVSQGQRAIYEVRIVNHQATAVEDVRTVVFFSDGMEPISVEGCRATITPGQVVFASIQHLAVGQEHTLRIIGRAETPGHITSRTEVTWSDWPGHLAAELMTRCQQTSPDLAH